MKNVRYLLVNLCFVLAIVFVQNVLASEPIVSISVNEEIGFEDVPVVQVEMKVNKSRDLHVVFQDMQTWRPVKRVTQRIKASGNYHFKVPIEGLIAGKKYRMDAYVTPRRKDWNDRIGKTHHQEMQVLDVPSLVQQKVFSKNDKVTSVSWPKHVDGNGEYSLKVRFKIREPRDLFIELKGAEDKASMGMLKFPVNQPGIFSIPIAQMASDFPAGKYVWAVYLAPQGKRDAISNVYGKHFNLIVSE